MTELMLFQVNVSYWRNKRIAVAGEIKLIIEKRVIKKLVLCMLTAYVILFMEQI